MLIRRQVADNSIKWFCPSCKHYVDILTIAMEEEYFVKKEVIDSKEVKLS